VATRFRITGDILRGQELRRTAFNFLQDVKRRMSFQNLKVYRDQVVLKTGEVITAVVAGSQDVLEVNTAVFVVKRKQIEPLIVAVKPVALYYACLVEVDGVLSLIYLSYNISTGTVTEVSSSYVSQYAYDINNWNTLLLRIPYESAIDYTDSMAVPKIVFQVIFEEEGVYYSAVFTNLGAFITDGSTTTVVYYNWNTTEIVEMQPESSTKFSGGGYSGGSFYSISVSSVSYSVYKRRSEGPDYFGCQVEYSASRTETIDGRIVTTVNEPGYTIGGYPLTYCSSVEYDYVYDEIVNNYSNISWESGVSGGSASFVREGSNYYVEILEPISSGNISADNLFPLTLANDIVYTFALESDFYAVENYGTFDDTVFFATKTTSALGRWGLSVDGMVEKTESTMGDSSKENQLNIPEVVTEYLQQFDSSFTPCQLLNK
jgi:hypothetical protein